MSCKIKIRNNLKDSRLHVSESGDEIYMSLDVYCDICEANHHVYSFVSSPTLIDILRNISWQDKLAQAKINLYNKMEKSLKSHKKSIQGEVREFIKRHYK